MKSIPALTACISTRSRLGNILFPLLVLLVIAAMAQPEPSFAAAQQSPAMRQDLETGQSLVESNDCRTCHSVAEKIIGPSYDAIAKRYQGDPGAIDKLAAKIKLGGAGNWGTIPMTPHPDLTSEQLEEMVEWILSLSPPAAQPGSPAGTQPAAAAQTPAAPAPPELQGSASRGEDLFAGRTAFHNHGPACIACHSVDGLRFPNGGTMAPNLTHTYTKLGPEGTAAAVETLYFPTMIPIYRDHQLIPQEQADLVAFFKRTAAGAKPEWKWTTQILILMAFVLGIIFVAITAFVWRKRLRSVRRELVARATGRGVRS